MPPPVSSGLGGRRWLILGVIGMARLMVVLDFTVMRQRTAGARRPTYGFLAAGVMLGVAFALWQGRAPYPLLPYLVVLDRNRGGGYASMLIASAGLFGTFFFLTHYLQQTLGYSPLVAGITFLPISAGSAISSNLATIVLMPRLEAAGRIRDAGRRGRDGLAGPAWPAHRVRRWRGRPADPRRGRHGHGDRPVDQHRDLRRGPAGRRGGIGDCHRRPAARCLGRHLAAEHHLRCRGDLLPDREPRLGPGRPVGRRWPALALRATWLADCAQLLGLATFLHAAGITCSQRLGDIIATLQPGTEAEAVALPGGQR